MEDATIEYHKVSELMSKVKDKQIQRLTKDVIDVDDMIDKACNEFNEDMIENNRVLAKMQEKYERDEKFTASLDNNSSFKRTIRKALE